MTALRPAGRDGRTTRKASIGSLALLALTVGLVATGCIQGHDPRTDASRLDGNRSVAQVAVSAGLLAN